MSQLEKKVLTQVHHLRLQQQYLMIPMDTEVSIKPRERRLVNSGYCQPQECSPLFILKCELLGTAWRVVIRFLKILFSDLTEALAQKSFGVWKSLAPSSPCRAWSVFMFPIPFLMSSRSRRPSTSPEMQGLYSEPLKHTGTLTLLKERHCLRGDSFSLTQLSSRAWGLASKAWVGFQPPRGPSARHCGQIQREHYMCGASFTPSLGFYWTLPSI